MMMLKKINEMGLRFLNHLHLLQIMSCVFQSQKTKLVYVSGTGQKPMKDITGKVDQDLTIEEGYDATRLTALNILGLKEKLGT